MKIVVYGCITGIVLYYKDFVEAIYQLLEGQASVTGKDYQLGHFKVFWTQNFADEISNIDIFYQQLGIFVMQQRYLEYNLNLNYNIINWWNF